MVPGGVAAHPEAWCILRLPPDVGPLLAPGPCSARICWACPDRLTLWLRNAGTSTLIIDPGITSLIWGLALWLVSAWAAWWLRRRRELLGVALLPATILLIYNIYYTNSKNGLLWLVLTGGGWILLQGLDSYMKARRRWQARQMGQTEIEPLLAGVTILLAAGIDAGGRPAPFRLHQKHFGYLPAHFSDSQSNQNLAESLGLQQTPAIFLHTGSAGIGLSDTHAIGPGPQLSQQVLMYVSVAGYQPPPPVDVADAHQRRPRRK